MRCADLMLARRRRGPDVRFVACHFDHWAAGRIAWYPVKI